MSFDDLPLFAASPPRPDSHPERGGSTRGGDGEVHPTTQHGQVGAPSSPRRCSRYESTTCLALGTVGLLRCPLCRETAEGEILKTNGMASADAAEGHEWKARADAAIAELAAGGKEFTAEDVRTRAGDPEHANAFGSRFLQAARRGLIICVGRRKSGRASLHAHEIRVWKGAETAPPKQQQGAG